jgi:glycosyltransferase involved in cell wall biosynthesis
MASEVRPERRVLMIAYAFPPTGGPGVQRSAKFAKFLPRFGWLPTVWTVEEAEGLPRDASLCDELPPEVTVCPRAAGGGVLAMRRSLRGFVNARAGEGLTGVASRFAKAVDWRLESWIASTSLPDDCIGWARKSVGPLLHRLEAGPIDLIYSTFSPASNHWLGLELKRRTGLPWVADFRDLWTDDCRYREPSPSRRASHRRLEQEILEAADVVIGVTPRQSKILSDHVPQSREKFLTITNGFDPEDFTAYEPPHARRREEFVLSYVGRFDLTQTSDEWFAALRSFVVWLGERSSRFTFRAVGHVNRTAQTRLTATGARCEFVDYVPHREAIEEMRNADALLLSAPTGPNGDSVIRAKVFEYLASRRPILAVGAKGGECERIVRACDAGVCATFDVRSILQGLKKLWGAWEVGAPIAGARPEKLRAYDREELTRQLAEAFDDLTVPREPAPTELLETCNA